MSVWDLCCGTRQLRGRGERPAVKNGWNIPHDVAEEIRFETPPRGNDFKFQPKTPLLLRGALIRFWRSKVALSSGWLFLKKAKPQQHLSSHLAQQPTGFRMWQWKVKGHQYVTHKYINHIDVSADEIMQLWHFVSRRSKVKVLHVTFWWWVFNTSTQNQQLDWCVEAYKPWGGNSSLFYCEPGI